jgi:methylase of polypeptide subunit release factors
VQAAQTDQALTQLATSLLRSGYHFVSPTPETHRRVNARAANSVAQDLAGIFGWSRPFPPALLAPPLLTLATAAGALEPAGTLLRSRYRVATLDGLAFLHSPYPTTQADAVFFGPDTYRFARALAAHLASLPAPPARAVDIGTGSGAAAILIARACPTAAVSMVDINEGALRLARINAAAAGVVGMTAARSDLLAGVPGAFDLITANPPYLPDPGRRAYRDGGGALGAALSLRIVHEATRRLARGGTLLLYTGTAIVGGANPFLAEAAGILAEAGFAWHAEEIDPDVFGEELDLPALQSADRIAAICLTATRPHGTRPHA